MDDSSRRTSPENSTLAINDSYLSQSNIDDGYPSNFSANVLDTINLKIIDELLSNADVGSSDIAKK